MSLNSNRLGQVITVSSGSEFVMFRLKEATTVGAIKTRVEHYMMHTKGKIKPYYFDGCSNTVDAAIVDLGTHIYVFNKRKNPQ